MGKERPRGGLLIKLCCLVILLAGTWLYFGTGGNTIDSGNSITEEGEYTTHEEVAEYINTYHYLPSNYVTKDEAEELGCRHGDNPSAYGKMIGGDYFGNYEKKLPDDKNYREADVDYKGRGRGSSRLVYTRDGTVYYTKDHYGHFTKLYD